MFGWLGKKMLQANVNRYKKEMETFLHSLQHLEKADIDTLAYWSARGAKEFLILYDCDVYTPFSSLEKFPGLDMGLFEQREKARRRGDHQSEKAIELWLHTVRGAAYTDHPELLALSKEIWLELGRGGELRYPEGFEPTNM